MSFCRIIPDASCVILAIILGFACPASATDYYVDAIRGNDDLQGTSPIPAQENGPWRSLGRLQSTLFLPGDRILLHCDGTWQETLSLRVHGTEEKPIKVEPFGECNGRLPLISPIDKQVLPEEFSATEFGWAAPLDKRPSMIVVNDAVVPNSRFPESSTLPIILANGKPRIQLSSIPVQKELLTGADWVVRTNDYTIEVRRLYGINNLGKPDLAKSFNFMPKAGMGYYLEGLPWMLKYSGGWAYDPDRSMLVVSDRPSVPVLIKNSASAILINQSSHLHLMKIGVKHVPGAGVDMLHSRDIKLGDMVIEDVGASFVRAQKVDNLVVSNLAGRNSQQDGIVAKQSNAVTIKDCRLEHIGVSANPRKSVAAVQLDDSPFSNVSNNHISKTGYAAIIFSNQTLVDNNIIEDTCLMLSDCGAIYTSGAHRMYGHYNSQVINNLISNVPGNIDGSTNIGNLTAGIYLDDETRGILVMNNFVEKAQRGIFSKATASQINNNTLFSNRAALYLSGKGARGAGPDKNLVTNNVLVSLKGDKSFLISASSSDAPIVDMTGNVIRHAGAMNLESWIAGIKTVHPVPVNAKRILNAISMFNGSAVTKSFTCPLPFTECGSLRNSSDEVVHWPIWLLPGEFSVLTLNAGT